MHDQALDEQVARLLGTPWTKPHHGPCCTCQTCGWEYDECQCRYSKDVEKTPLLMAEIARRGLQRRYVGWFYKHVCTDDMDGRDETWAIMTATPEQHCRAFVAAIEDA